MSTSSITINDPINALPTFVVALDLRPIVACSDESYAEIRQQWINEAYSLQLKLQKEVEKLTENDIDVCDQKHEAIVVRCKEARNKFDDVVLQRAYFESRERELSRQVNQASLAVRVKKDSPLTPTYSTKADIQQWESELAELQSAESAKISEYHNHQQLMSMWLADCNRLKAIHDDLAVEERLLRGRLNRLRGVATEPQRDQTTGLRA